MKRFLYSLHFLVFLAIAFHATHVHAANGSSQAVSNEALEITDVVAFSKKVERVLASNKARVALISRTGRPQSQLPDGVRYTHVAFAVYSSIVKADGSTQPGYAVYNLYQQPDSPDRSDLVQDYPVDFYRSAMQLKSGVIIPTEALQDRLLETINSPVYAAMHNPSYSAISNPFTNKVQNCTEFVMNVTQAAIYQTDDMKAIKHSLQSYFEPYRVKINPLAILVGAAFSEDVAITDHKGPVKTATFSSIQRYFETNNLAREVIEVSL